MKISFRELVVLLLMISALQLMDWCRGYLDTQEQRAERLPAPFEQWAAQHERLWE